MGELTPYLDQISVFGLLLIRVTGMILTAPLFSSRSIPMTVRVAVTLLFVVVLMPGGLAVALSEPRLTPTTVLSEATVGALLGLGAGVFVGAAETAGDMLAVQMGISGANVVNPTSDTQVPVLGQMLGLLVVTALLALDGHLLLLAGLSRSTELVPPGATVTLEGIPSIVLRHGAALFTLGLQIAAPVIAATMVGNAALGVFARAVPQLNVLMVAFPLQIGIGLLCLALAVPLLGPFLHSFPDLYQDMVTRGVDSLLPDGAPVAPRGGP